MWKAKFSTFSPQKGWVFHVPSVEGETPAGTGVQGDIHSFLAPNTSD